MKIIHILFLCVIIPLKALPSETVKDGLYYSYWVYSDNGEIKTYSALANSPKRNEQGKFVLSNKDGSSLEDEIFINIQNGNTTIYYQQGIPTDNGNFVTFGWANAILSKNKITISPVNIKITPITDLKNVPTVPVNIKFKGKSLPLDKKEIFSLEEITTDSFKVNCASYLKDNKYRENGLPLYDDGSQSYNATIFSTENGVCGLLLEDDITPEIKHGWILFKKIE